MLHRLCTTPSDAEAFDRELKYIMDTAKINGYKNITIKKLLKKHIKKKKLREITTLVNEPDKTKNYLVLPFVPDLTHDLEKVFKKYNIQVAYESSGKLGDLLGNCKDKTPELHKSGIYIIYCKMCQAYYIGQSKRRVGKRITWDI
jgi:hypothetical protein